MLPQRSVTILQLLDAALGISAAPLALSRRGVSRGPRRNRLQPLTTC
jgi:hypothetical protein